MNREAGKKSNISIGIIGGNFLRQFYLCHSVSQLFGYWQEPPFIFGVNGLDYGYDLSFVNSGFTVNGTNIVYGSHPYNDKGKRDYTGAGGDFDHNFAGVLGQYLIMFTEFGVNSGSYFPNGYQAVYQRDLEYADSHNISYTSFAWWVDQANPDTFPDLISNWNGDPINGGVLIKKDIQNNPPSKIDAQ